MAAAPRIGTEFAGYRLEGLLGRGGMGIVYRAEHPRLGATVALKVMDAELALDEAFRERFVREARAAARISHPNIIPIYDAGEWEGDLYLAMRYVEGDNLKSLLRKHGALPPEQIQVLGAQIAGALDAAHRSGLLHRDVKPGNIIVEQDGDPDSPSTAYLADLGLTKNVDANGGVTGSGELLGTIDYIAPEQIAGSRIDGRADVYSLACVFFECLTGSIPYARENQAAVLWAHLHDEVPPATALNSALPRDVDAVLARGMAKVPENRFSTGRELVAALQTALEGSGVTGPIESGTLVARSSAASMPSPLAREPAALAARQRSTRRALALAALVGALLGGAVAGAAFLLSDDETAAPRPTSEEPTAGENTSTLTPFEQELLPHVPDELQADCRHAPPLTDQFDATLSCPNGAVSSLTYSHARSGFHLYDFFLERMAGAGLTAADPPVPTGSCRTADIPAVNVMVPFGLSGRAETPERVSRGERLGFVLCYEDAGRAHIEWMTGELGVYSIATGDDVVALYDWWQRDAGPEP